MKYIDPKWHLKNQEKIIKEASKLREDGTRRNLRIRRCKQCGLCFESITSKFRVPPPECVLCRCERSSNYKQIVMSHVQETWEEYYNKVYRKGLLLAECLKREYEVLGVKVTNERITTRLSLTK